MKKYKNLNLKYALVNISFLMLVCATAGYAYNYLSKNGFPDSAIGIIIALISVCGVVGQTIFGDVIDRSEKLDEKTFISISMIVCAALAVLLMILPEGNFLIVPLVIVGFTSASIGMPFLNSMAFIYEKDGQKINYGLCRGLGSGAYAVGSALLGQLWASFGKGILPIYLIVLSLITFLLVRIMPTPAKDIVKEAEAEEAVEQKQQLSYGAFFKKYNKVVIIVVSLILIYFAHMIINTYMAKVIGNIINSDDVESVQGTAMFIQAMVELPTMFAFSLLLKKLSINKLLIIATVFYTIKHALILISGNIGMLYAAMILQMLSYAILVPGSVYFANENIEPEDRNKGQAIFGATATVGGLLASAVGGTLFSIMSVKGVLTIGLIATALGMFLMFVGIKRIEA